MSAGHLHHEPPSVRRELQKRCLSLGLAVWDADHEGLLTEESVSAEQVQAFFASPGLRKRLQSVMRLAEQHDETAFVPFLPGAWLLPVKIEHEEKKSASLAILAFGPSVIESEYFQAFCREAEVDPETMAQVLEPALMYRAEDLVQIQRVLNWTQDDLESLRSNNIAIQDLSHQLSYSYDEISSLYQLGRSMNNLDEPKLFVQSICSQLHYLLDYQWVAVQYVPSNLSIMGLERELIVEGELPCPAKDFSCKSSELIESWQTDHWTCLLEMEQNELARMAGSQLVVEPISHDGIVIGAIFAGAKCGEETDATSIDMQLLDTTSDFLGVFHQNAARFEVQRSLFMGTVRVLSSSIDAKDPYTRGHSDRVAQLSRQLAQARGMSAEQIERIYICGLLHDVGKIGVPEATLRKPGKLTEEEFDQIKQHPVIGYDILKDIPQMEDLLPGVLHHHERWDGDGYPHGLAGNDIPLLGRLLAVADAFDAMSSDRAYRSRMSREKVISILRDGAGSQWDAEMVHSFLTLDFTEFDEMVRREEMRQSKAA